MKVRPQAPPIPVDLCGTQLVCSCELQADDGGHVAYGVILRLPGTPIRLVAFWWDRYATPPTWAQREVDLHDLLGPAAWRA